MVGNELRSSMSSWLDDFKDKTLECDRPSTNRHEVSQAIVPNEKNYQVARTSSPKRQGKDGKLEE